MGQHEAILKSLYPSQQRFRALLPNGDRSEETIDLSAFNMKCRGLIGRGLMSSVYRVTTKDSDRKDFACKVTCLYNEQAQLPADKIAEYTLREIQIVKRLMQNKVHGILPILYFSPDEATIEEYIRQAKAGRLNNEQLRERVIVEIMPLSVGYSDFMNEIFRSGRHLTEPEVAALMLDLLQPLKFIQLNDIVHRDIKPANIMLHMLPDGSIRAAIADYNVSRMLLPGERDMTQVGTRGYRPQTYVRSVDAPKNDIYAVGQIFYILLNAGQMAPYQKNVPAPKNSPSPRITELLRRMLSDDLQSIPTVDEVISECKAMLQALHASPQKNQHRQQAAFSDDGFCFDDFGLSSNLDNLSNMRYLGLSTHLSNFGNFDSLIPDMDSMLSDLFF